MRRRMKGNEAPRRTIPRVCVCVCAKFPYPAVDLFMYASGAGLCIGEAKPARQAVTTNIACPLRPLQVFACVSPQSRHNSAFWKSLVEVCCLFVAKSALCSLIACLMSTSGAETGQSLSHIKNDNIAMILQHGNLPNHATMSLWGRRNK